MTVALLAQTTNGVTDAAASTAAWYRWPVLWAAVLLAVGIWLCLPRRSQRGTTLGALFSVAGLFVLGTQLPAIVGLLDRSIFTALATVTVLACLATISSRNPMYSAIWFGLALLGTAGLFFLNGAQFLSVATITVYAGAILVTFLFVIMLAQPKGQANYDRLSWEALLSAAAGAIIVGLLTTTVARSLPKEVAASAIAAAEFERTQGHGVLAEQHVAHLGQELIGRHFISMQAAGVLMLVALVAAVAVVSHSSNQQTFLSVKGSQHSQQSIESEERIAV